MKTMLLTRLKTFVAVALVVFLGAGAVGLTYRTGAAEPAQPGAGRPLADELDELRLEVEALRKGLQATRDRVKTLEAEVQGMQGKRQFRGAGQELRTPTPSYQRDVENYYQWAQQRQTLRRPPAEDPVAEAEAALKKLRQNPKDQQAVEELDKALKQLKGATSSPQSK
jgi:hypothetical protein